MNNIEYKYFLEVSKTLNISHAANNLFISQPALSHCISKLEKEFGTKLLNRNKSKISLTNAGKTLLREYPKIMMINDQFKQSITLANKGEDCIYIGIQDGFIFNNKLKNIFLSFEKKYPNICLNYIHLPYKNIFTNLDSNNIDIALAFDFDKKNSANFNKTIISEEDNYLLLGKNHPLLSLNNYDDIIKNLNNYTLLSVDNSILPMINNLLLKCCNANNICPKDIKYINNNSTLITNLIMNNGFTIYYKSELINNNLIEYIPLKHSYKSNFCLYYKNENSNNIKFLIDHINNL